MKTENIFNLFIKRAIEIKKDQALGSRKSQLLRFNKSYRKHFYDVLFVGVFYS